MLPLARLIVTDLERAVGAGDGARERQAASRTTAREDAAQAFERYDLVSAPVVDDVGTPGRAASR